MHYPVYSSKLSDVFFDATGMLPAEPARYPLAKVEAAKAVTGTKSKAPKNVTLPPLVFSVTGPNQNTMGAENRALAKPLVQATELLTS